MSREDVLGFEGLCGELEESGVSSHGPPCGKWLTLGLSYVMGSEAVSRLTRRMCV